MIIPSYRIKKSLIAGAGQGLFFDEKVAAGSVLIAPDRIPEVHRWSDVLAMPDPEAARGASVRWFEEYYTVSLDWPDECYVNHSFTPNGLWHLGFVFAQRPIAPGDELTIDYRHLLPEGEAEVFNDVETGEAIIGWSGKESLRRSTRALARLIDSAD